MSFQDSVNVNFVYKNDQIEASDDMKQASIYLNDYISAERVKWINESKTIDLISFGELTKQDVFVLEEFEGQVFEDLQTTPSVIVGPRCLLICLIDYKPIPDTNSPVYITAMRDLHICCSGFDIEQKKKLKNLISYMGGYYLTELNRKCNYLISNTILSNKYEQAVINSIPLMQSEWVDAVWEIGKKQTILATDSIFEKYKLPIFYGANITVSGLPNQQKEEIIKLVEENGGNFHRSFKARTTDILIIAKDGITSDKFKAAISFKKEVLLPTWIYDSVKEGVALPFKSYIVKKLKNSTPTKSGASICDFTGNFTQISHISNNDISSNIDETVCSINNSVKRQTRSATTTRTNEKNSYQQTLALISPHHAKKAGTFLDGCCIFLSGFTNDEKEKLNKILNVGGATRYNEFNDNITHIIIGAVIDSELALWREQRSNIVTLEWLVESIKIKQPANESKYRLKLPIQREPEAPSPQTKKNLHSMNSSFKKPELPKKRLNFTEINTDMNRMENDDRENDFLTHYSLENNMSVANLPLVDLPASSKYDKLKEIKKSENPKIKSIEKLSLTTTDSLTDQNLLSTDEYENLNFFDGLTIFIDTNYEQEYFSQTIVDCETAGGKVVTSTYRDTVDYVIVSSNIPVDIQLIPIKTKNIVNNIWLDVAIQYNKLVNIEYYHRPISILAAKKPLNGLTITISAYSNYERQFIQFLVTILGAKCKDQYDRKDKPVLVCYSTTTEKYEAALKWNYPVVNSKWLVNCSETGEFEPMEPYLVGNAKVVDYFSQLYKNSSSKLSDMSTPKQHYVDKKQQHTPLLHKRIVELADGCQMKTPENKLVDGNIAPDSPLFGDIDEFLSDIECKEVREFIKKGLLEVQNHETPELERLKRLARTPNVSNSPATPQGVPEFCTTPAYRKRMLEYLDKRFYLSVKKVKPETPLAELRKRLWRATLPPEFVATCKYLQDDKKSDESEKQKQPQPSTSFDSPVTRNLNHSASTSVSANTNQHHKSFSVENDNENQSPGVKRLKDYLENCKEERRSSKKVIESTPLEEETQGLPQHFESEMFDSELMVVWGNADDFTLSRRTKVNAKLFKGIPVFNISGLQESEKYEICNKITRLRGEMCTTLNSYDPKCTHIVCEKPNRGEKLLSSVAAGKWILSPNYISDSYKEGYFLDEELYEWGNPKAKNIHLLQDTEQSIANTFYCWRQKIALNSEIVGAFTGQKIILCLSNKTLLSLKTVLEAGDGTILATTSPYDDEIILQATHCYVDTRCKLLSPNEHKKLRDADVYVLDFLFISKYLTVDPNTDVKNYILSL